NAAAGHVWEQFSSPEYKNLPRLGELTFYNPVTGQNDLHWRPRGGGGYYRTSSLVSIWATAPFLHNNSVGIFTGDPSVPGRLKAFDDGIHKLLWTEQRDGVKSIKRVRTRTYLNLRLSVLGDVARERLQALKPDLPQLPGLSRPELFNIVEPESIKDLTELKGLDRLSIRIPVPEGTPINLLANINI